MDMSLSERVKSASENVAERVFAGGFGGLSKEGEFLLVEEIEKQMPTLYPLLDEYNNAFDRLVEEIERRTGEEKLCRLASDLQFETSVDLVIGGFWLGLLVGHLLAGRPKSIPQLAKIYELTHSDRDREELDEVEAALSEAKEETRV